MQAIGHERWPTEAFAAGARDPGAGRRVGMRGRRRRRPADVDVVHQPRQRWPGGVGQEVRRRLRRRLQHRDADPAQRSRPAARTARPPARGRRSIDRPDESRPTLRRRVRQRRIPPPGHRPGRRRVVQRRGARGTAGIPPFWDGQLVAPVFWANTQLLWYRKSVAAGGRRRPDRSRLHVAGDDRGGRGGGQADRRPGSPVRGLHGVDQRPGSLGWRADHREPRTRRRRHADGRVAGREPRRRDRR